MRHPSADDDLDDDEWFAANRGRSWRLRPCRLGEGDDPRWWALVPVVRWVPGAPVPPDRLPPGCWRGDEDELLRAWFGWVAACPIPPREPADPEEAIQAAEAAARAREEADAP